MSDARRLKSLEGENRRLKKLLAEAVLHNTALMNLLEKKRLTPAARPLALERLMAEHEFSQRRACRLIGCDGIVIY